MVGAHISVSVLETPRTLDSFFPPVDETQPRRWAKALLRRQAAPRCPAPRDKARQPVDSRMGPFSPFPTSSPRSPPSSPSTKVTGASRRAWASRLLSPWRQRGSLANFGVHSDPPPLGSLQAEVPDPTDKFSGKVGKLLGIWKNWGRIGEEWGGRLSLPNIPRRRVKFPFSFSELSSETAVVQHNQGFCCREVCLHW